MNYSSIIDNKILFICQHCYEFFFKKLNVVGVGMGYKRKGNVYFKEQCITVLVCKKVSITNLSCDDIIPKTYEGITTDVIETGVFVENSLRNRIRPIIGGYGIGTTFFPNLGTISCLVSDGVSMYILGCNHTLALRNTAPINTEIIQPSFLDGGNPPDDIIAHLTRYVPLHFMTPTEKPPNLVDCAIAKLINPTIALPSIAYVGNPKGSKTPVLHEDVKKVGCTTGLTTGNILLLGATIEVTSPVGPTILYENQIVTTKMSTSGDSGALLLNNDNYALGLIASSSEVNSTANLIDIVLDLLDVFLVTN